MKIVAIACAALAAASVSAFAGHYGERPTDISANSGRYGAPMNSTQSLHAPDYEQGKHINLGGERSLWGNR